MVEGLYFKNECEETFEVLEWIKKLSKKFSKEPSVYKIRLTWPMKFSLWSVKHVLF